MSEATVRFWFGRFNALGPEGLYDEPRSGRPRKVTAEVKGTIERLVGDDPKREVCATFWSVAMMCWHWPLRWG